MHINWAMTRQRNTTINGKPVKILRAYNAAGGELMVQFRCLETGEEATVGARKVTIRHTTSSAGKVAP